MTTNGDGNPGRVFYGWWVVLASTFGLIVCNGPVVFTFTVFIPPLIEEFGWSRGDVSLSLTFHTVANAIAMPFAGVLLDRFGARWVLSRSITLWGVGVALLYAIPGSLWAFYAAFALLGVVASGSTPLPYGRAISSWFDARRGLALGIATSGTGLGTLIIPVFANGMINSAGWRIAFAGIGALILAVGLFIVLPLFRDSSSDSGESTGADTASAQTSSAHVASEDGLTYREALRDRNFWLMASAFSIVAITVFGTAAHLVPMLVDTGIPGTKAVFAVSTLGISLLAGRIWAGYLLDRHFAPYVAIAFFCGPIVGCLIFASGAGGILPFLAAAAVGLGIGAEVDMIAYFLGRYLGLRAFGVLYGLLFGGYLFAGGIGPPLMGYGYDASGSYAGVLYGFAVSTAFACILLSRMGPYPTSFSAYGAART